jgi:hypothetical protein
MRRTVGHVVTTGLLAINGVNGLAQIGNEIRDPESGSLALALLHLAVALCSFAAAFGLWRRASWAPLAVVAWGITCAAMIVLLEPLHFADGSDRASLWQGAAAVLVVAAILYWYVKRCVRSAPPAA